MSTLSPPVLHRLDLACKPLKECFGTNVYLVGSVQKRTNTATSDFDLRLILPDDEYDSLMAGAPVGYATLLDFALGAYLRELTGLPIDFQVQRRTEANENHDGPRNPLGRRKLTAWAGDARPARGDA